MIPSLNKAVVLALACALLVTAFPVFSQQSSIASISVGISPVKVIKSDSTSPVEPALALNRFVASEAEVREALNQHTFRRDVVLQTIGPNGEVTGEYIRNSQFVFDNKGKRIERVLFHPKSTIREMRITKEDIQDLAGAQLLGIDITETAKYKLTYVGQETVESRQLIAVDVSPFIAPNPHRMKDRFFVGRVWLDPATFQIVKVKGIVEPQGKQRFPQFETWREPVKGNFAFPVRTEADDVLHFKDSDVHYRIKVRYYDYQLFASRVKIKELEDMPALPPDEANTTNSNDLSVPKVDAPPRKSEPKKNKKTSENKSSWNDAEACTPNRTAPPVGAYHWPADSEVKVYFVRGLFTSDQRSALLEAMATWSTVNEEVGSGVRFVQAGEVDTRQTCQGCLTIRRAHVYQESKRHYAYFYPMKRVDRTLVSAWIDFDFGITKPSALKGFMAHELAHGLGLWDCTSCKKKKTIMNGFPGLNKDNGLVAPSRCDLATVRGVYQEERLLVQNNLRRLSPAPVETVGGESAPRVSDSQNPLNLLLRFTPSTDVFGSQKKESEKPASLFRGPSPNAITSTRFDLSHAISTSRPARRRFF